MDTNTDPTCLLLPPRRPLPLDNLKMRNRIAARIQTIYQLKTVALAKRVLKDIPIMVWGKVKRVDSEAGDTISASDICKAAPDSRDSTFVRVSAR